MGSSFICQFTTIKSVRKKRTSRNLSTKKVEVFFSLLTPLSYRRQLGASIRRNSRTAKVGKSLAIMDVTPSAVVQVMENVEDTTVRLAKEGVAKSLEPRRTRRPQRKRKALLCALRGALLFRAFCTALEGGCYKRNLKRRESQRHKVHRKNTARWLNKLVHYGWLRLNNKPELLLIR